MSDLIITNAVAINEDKKEEVDIEISKGRIHRIERAGTLSKSNKIIDANGIWLLPGVIDDQVHFREPGFTHKAEIATESSAAVAGGVTSFMEMPNTNPQTINKEELEMKFNRAAQVSPANYSFFFGATNKNADEVLALDDDRVCGIKIFMGSSTGDMLVDNEAALEKIFANCSLLIATHCEDEPTIRKNMEEAKIKFNNQIPIKQHPIIRSREVCILSSQKAIALAKKYNSRLHILHITTAEEAMSFESGAIENKRITAEACVHHLWFSDMDYDTLGSEIQCNPAVKTANDRDTIWQALKENRIDIIATDHAPHTLEEKAKPYPQSPSGLPLVQHSLNMMMHRALEGKITPEWVVEKMCHAPAKCFKLRERGFIREGYFADLVLFDPTQNYTVTKQNILYKCAWSPLENFTFNGNIFQTFVNGTSVFENGKLTGLKPGMALKFR
ncbi:MAG: dihydroorotase [Bacteroidetes bacterium]|nr:dihydroorotase [Bacteroidota bacterium]